MSDDRWSQVQALVEEAMQRSSAERTAFVASACGTDHALRDEVMSLLEATAVDDMPTVWLGSLAEPVDDLFAHGDRVADRYIIGRLLGRGGMSEVYEAEDTELSITVALKALMLAELNEHRLERLQLESLLARAIWHPNVCRVYDLGRHGEGASAVWFLTMERLHGTTLAARLTSSGPIPTEHALPLVEQMTVALGAAHRAGVIHLDFKPGNVMLVDHEGVEQAVVTDFGTARAVTGRDLGVASSPSVTSYGTPAYMAPEQLTGDPLTPAADIYALGVVLFEMITGAPPFDGDSLEIASRRLTHDPPSPRDLIPALDPRWERVILRCLDRNPRRRFARVEDVARALAGTEIVAVHASSEYGDRPAPAMPAEQDPFVGRISELAAMDAACSAGTRVVTLVGAGGVGKTRLALHWAWAHADAWPGGVWFCDLTDARNADDIAAVVAGAFGVRLERDPIAQLGHAVASRGHCLIVLDNCEQIVGHGADTIGRWRQQARDACWLVTSRERLSLEDECVQSVEPLESVAGVELFILRARGLRPRFDPTGSDLQAVREIVRLVDGMPLAIELAAARIRVMPATAILEGMRRRFSLLTGGRGARHETLAGAIDGSWELLRPFERAAWMQCSVFEGGFTLDAATAVLEFAPSLEAPPVIDVLRTLVEKCLLRMSTPERSTATGSREPRFAMYVSLQEYARQKLDDRAHRGAEARHSRWFAAFGNDAALAALSSRGGDRRRMVLLDDYENLLAACRRATERLDGATAVGAFRAVWEVLDLHGPFSTAIALSRQVLSCPMQAGERGRALVALGWAERRAGRSAEALEHAREAIASFREADDATGAGLALLGVSLADQGRTADSQRCCDDALALARAAADRHAEAVALNQLAIAHSRQGNLADTQTCFEAALAIHRETGNRRSEGMVLNNLGILNYELGRPEIASECFETALAIHRETGDRRAEAIVLNGLANLCGASQREEEMTHLRAALAIDLELGSRSREAITRGNLCAVLASMGRVTDARYELDTAMAAAREVNNLSVEAIMYGQLGERLLEWGDLTGAGNALVRAESLCRELGDPIQLGKVLCYRARLEHRTGRRAVALVTAQEIEGIAQAAGMGADSQIGVELAKLWRTLDFEPPAAPV